MLTLHTFFSITHPPWNIDRPWTTQSRLSFSAKSISFQWTGRGPDSFTKPALFQSLMFTIRLSLSNMLQLFLKLGQKQQTGYQFQPPVGPSPLVHLSGWRIQMFFPANHLNSFSLLCKNVQNQHLNMLFFPFKRVFSQMFEAATWKIKTGRDLTTSLNLFHIRKGQHQGGFLAGVQSSGGQRSLRITGWSTSFQAASWSRKVSSKQTWSHDTDGWVY